jgi:hypothetical protein
MKYFFLLFCLFVFSCGHPKHPSTVKSSKSAISISALKRKRDNIEAYSLQHKNNMLVFAKVPGKDVLLKIENEKWPDEVEYSYNVLKDDNGEIIMIDASPFSESGDWDVSHTHYFYSDGNTFLFERKANAFNGCLTNDSVVYETVKKYFAPSFKLLKQQDIVVDKNGKALDKSKCVVDFAIEDANVYPNVNACLKAYRIIL